MSWIAALGVLLMLLFAGFAQGAETVEAAAAEECTAAAEVECATGTAVVTDDAAAGEGVTAAGTTATGATEDPVTPVVDETVAVPPTDETVVPAVPTPRIDTEVPVVPVEPDPVVVAAPPTPSTQPDSTATPPLGGEVAEPIVPAIAPPDPVSNAGPAQSLPIVPAVTADAPPPTDVVAAAAAGVARDDLVAPPPMDFSDLSELVSAGVVTKFEQGLAAATPPPPPSLEDVFATPVDWAVPAAVAPATLLDVLATYFVPGNGGSYTATLAALIQLAFILGALSLLRPRHAAGPLRELRQSQPVGYRAVVFRPG